jgi:HEAT repeat protein
LRTLRDAVVQIPPDQKGELVQKLTDLIRDDPNALIRREAVLTAGYEDSPDIVPALRLAISDADPDVRSAACVAWRRHGGSDAEEVLAAVARDDTELDVRMAAVTELQHFRGPAALAALAKALDDPDPALQYRAVLTLREVSDTDYGYNVYAWREYLRGNNPPVPQAPSFVERVKRWF